MDLTTGIVFGEDYYGDEVNELAVASFNYVKQDIADVKKRYMSLGFHLHEMELLLKRQLKFREDVDR